MWLVFVLFVLSEPNHLPMCSNPASVFLLARVQIRSRRAFSALFVRWRTFFILFLKSSTCVVFISAMYTKTISRIGLRLSHRFPCGIRWLRVLISEKYVWLLPTAVLMFSADFWRLFMNLDSDTFHGRFVSLFSLVEGVKYFFRVQ